MRPKKVLATSLVLAHLALVATFLWTDFARRPPRPVAAALRLYLNLTGTFRDYTYFAPSVANDLKAGFLLEDAAGRARLVPFASDNGEVDFRYGCIIYASMWDEAGRDIYAQSWAALLLGSNPEAERVTVMVRRLEMPSMELYRRGERPRWETVYAGEFARRRPAP